MPLLRVTPANGLGLWAIAVALGVAGQLAFTLQQVWPGRVLFLVSVLVGVVAFRGIDRNAPPPRQDTGLASPESAVGGRGRWAPPALFGASVGASLILVPRLVAAGNYDGALLLWLAALAGTLLGALVRDTGLPLRLAGLNRPNYPELAALALVIVATVALRFPSIESIPPTVHGDEGLFGLIARDILEGRRPDYFSRADNHLGDVINSVSLRVLGNDLRGLRLGSAIAGTLSVLMLYLLVRRLFGARPAIISAWLLGAAQWHIHYSRNGMTCMQALTATLLLLWLLVRAMQTRSAIGYALVGFAAALCLHVYYPARLAPVIAGLYVLHLAVSERAFLLRHRDGVLPAVLGFVVFQAPFGVGAAGVSWAILAVGLAGVGLSALLRARPVASFVVRPRHAIAGAAFAALVLGSATSVVRGANVANVEQRAASVFVFSQHGFRHQSTSYETDSPLAVLGYQTLRTIEAFNRSGESSQQYFRRGMPLLDFWTAALLPMGVLAVTLGVRRSPFSLIATWIWLTLIVGSILTVDAPFTPRIIAVLPALVVPPALVLDAGVRGAQLRWGRRGMTAATVGVAVILGLALVANYRDYFQDHIFRFLPPGFATVVGREINQINAEYRVLLITDQPITLHYETIQFLAPGLDGETIGDRPLPLPLPRDAIPATKGIAFIVQAGTPLHQQRLRELQSVYGRGVQRDTISSLGAPMYTTYLVGREELVDVLERSSALRIIHPGHLRG